MAIMTPPTATAAPIPPSPSNHAPNPSHDNPYSATFEDSLIDLLLPNTPQSASPADNTGIRVIPSTSDEEPIPNVSVRERDIDWLALPTVREEELPLPLHDGRRIFASPIPSLRLTHPEGPLQGGPPPPKASSLETFTVDFLSGQGVATPVELDTALEAAIQEQMGIARERLEARKRAKERNEQIQKDLRVLGDQHGMEVKLRKRLADEARAKREGRERRRREREAG